MLLLMFGIGISDVDAQCGSVCQVCTCRPIRARRAPVRRAPVRRAPIRRVRFTTVCYTPTYIAPCYDPCGGCNSGCGSTICGYETVSYGCGSTVSSGCSGCGGHSASSSSYNPDPIEEPTPEPAGGEDEAPAEEAAEEPATPTEARNGFGGYGQFVSIERELEATDLPQLAEELLANKLIGKSDSKGVFSAYFEAIIARRVGMEELANEKLAAAVQLEKKYTVSNWGHSMERIQGPERNWIENARFAN